MVPERGKFSSPFDDGGTNECLFSEKSVISYANDSLAVPFASFARVRSRPCVYAFV